MAPLGLPFVCMWRANHVPKSQILNLPALADTPTHTHTFPKPHTSTDAERDLLNSERDVEGELLGQLQELHRQLAEVS